MKKLLFAFAIATIVWSCKTTISSTSASVKEEIQVNINLNEIKDDKVLVTIKTPKITTDEVTYYVPKTVPGTYSEDIFGK